MRYPVAALLTTVAFAILGGCGQMGPLYMPPEEVPQSKPVEPAPISQQQTEDA